MDIHELEEWILNLPTQTLTEELKETIWEEVEQTIHNNR